MWLPCIQSKATVWHVHCSLNNLLEKAEYYHEDPTSTEYIQEKQIQHQDLPIEDHQKSPTKFSIVTFKMDDINEIIENANEKESLTYPQSLVILAR